MNLKKNRIISGNLQKYTVIRPECYSERSKTWIVKDTGGRLFRLKCYDGFTTINAQCQDKFEKLPEKCAGLCVVDRGKIEGILFDVFPILEDDLSTRMISMHSIRLYLLPQLIEGLHGLHTQGLLLRDLCPDHILTNKDETKFFLCGFSNVVSLKPPAIKTSIPDYGVDPLYRAPECDLTGFSYASDYYALGVLLYYLWCKVERLVFSPFQKPEPKRIKDQRMRQLLEGLLCRDPFERWRERQVDEWIEEKEIHDPDHVFFGMDQLTEPFVFNSQKCWEYSQLAELIGKSAPDMTEEQFEQLLRDLSKNQLTDFEKIRTMLNEDLSISGKCFRLIYLLCPETDGLWVGGRNYHDSETLLQDAVVDGLVRNNLRVLAKERALSFWANLVGMDDRDSLEWLAEMEEGDLDNLFCERDRRSKDR